MKEGWEIKKLDDACEVEYGTRVVRKRDGGTIYPVYGGGGATFFMDTSNREDCMVVARFAMSEQCTRFVKGKFFLNDSGLTIKPKDDSEILPDFLNLQIHFLNDYIYSLSRGTAQRNLDVPKFRNIKIAYPKSLPEQQRIVSILDECFAAIDKAKSNAEQNLKNAKELFESYLQGVFEKKGDGWIQTTLSELFDVKHGYAFQGKYFSNKGEYVLLTPGNFYEEGGYRDRGEKQKYYNGEIPSDFILRQGDLLVAMTEQAAGLLGSPIIVPESNKFLHNQRLGLIIPKPDVEIDNEFFYHVFNLKKVRQTLHDSGTGVKVRHTSPNKIGQVEISYPKTKNEQQTIVRQLDALRSETQKLEAVYQKKMEDLEELKKSILQKAFSGELKTEKALTV